jgi:hypothetical protein
LIENGREIETCEKRGDVDTPPFEFGREPAFSLLPRIGI